jgi:hypothetical protein
LILKPKDEASRLKALVGRGSNSGFGPRSLMPFDKA